MFWLGKIAFLQEGIGAAERMLKALGPLNHRTLCIN
jgi:hypothetical protein